MQTTRKDLDRAILAALPGWLRRGLPQYRGRF